ncbi:MAG: septum formation initiator family protein [Brevinematia bacterium]
MKEEKALMILLAILFLTTVAFIFSLIFSKGGILDSLKKERRVEDLKKQVRDLELSNLEKQKRIEMLKNDREYLDSIVKGFGINIKENEYIFRFDDAKRNTLRKTELDNANSLKIMVIVVGLFLFQLGLLIAVSLGVLSKKSGRN